jgi:hypothetical protein
MKDVFGSELSLGDEVATIVQGYRHLVVGKIVRLTAKRIIVEVPSRWGLPGVEETVRTPNQLVRKG